jgi:hypothetical protein
MFQPELGSDMIERRRSRRSRATCGACLETPDGEIFGQLWDLSETGARVQTTYPPEQGTQALLKWNSEKVECQVIWASDDMCGVEFDSPIDRAVVTATGRIIGLPEQAGASLAKIPLGQKRSAQ